MTSGLMKPGGRRRLTTGEISLAEERFGEALAAERVSVFALPVPRWDRGFVPGRWFGRDWIVLPHTAARADFAAAPIEAQALFIHELAHVWQAQAGVNLLFAKLRAGDSAASYCYHHLQPCPWRLLNIEQQAMLVEDAFRASRGLPAPWPAEAYAASMPFAPAKDRLQRV